MGGIMMGAAPGMFGEYAGGGSFDGTVKAFIPGRSGRLVAGEGLESNGAPMFVGPLIDVSWDCSIEVLFLDEELLFLRPSLVLMEPKRERPDVG
jgi:hypothetical protein